MGQLLRQCKDAIVLKGLAFIDKICVYWAVFALGVLLCTSDAALWFYATEVANLIFALLAIKVRDITLPDYFPED